MSVGPGSRLSRYEVIGEISRGGMGIVYRAVDTLLHREVALKVLPPELVADEERRQRFVQEAQSASAIEHPNIAVIHEIGDADGVTFIAMELIRGEKLSVVLTRGPLPPGRALDLAIETAEALARAHEVGVVHRDLKPANLMLTDQGHIKVIDFGLAKLVGPLAGDDVEETFLRRQTLPGTVLGTVSYMSPEQARGGRVDHRTDIFTFGVLLHEMLTAEPPFRGATGADTLNAILTLPPHPLPPLGGTVAPGARDLIARVRDKCLEKAPDDRYQGMRDVVVDLRAARRHLESAPLPAPPTRDRRRWTWRVAAAAMVAVIGLAAASWEWRRAAPAVPADQKPSVAVLHFENNTGNPSLDWLRTGLADMLVTDLSQSPDIEILGTDRVQQILTELNHADQRAITFDVVQELARRAGVRTVLVGSYVKSGESIRINVRLQDAEDGRILSAERVEALGEENLFPTMDDLTRRLRVRLAPARGELFSRPTGETVAPADVADRDLRDVTTSSIEAYRYYAEGVNLHERFLEAEAVPLFEKALAIDPSFALAMAKLAVVHSNLNHPAESASYARRAYEHVDRVTLRERYYIEGEYFGKSEDTLAQAIRAYETGLAQYPDHASVRNNLALHFLQLERRREAIAHLEELRRRRVPFVGSYGMLAVAHALEGELDQSVAVLEEYIARHPDVSRAHGFLGDVYMAWGRLDEALQAYDRAAALEPGATVALRGRFQVHVLDGRWHEAQAASETLIRSQDVFRRWLGHVQSATLAMYGGRAQAALASLERSVRLYTTPGSNTAQSRLRASALLLATGDEAGALREAQTALSEARGTVVQWPAYSAVIAAQLALGRQAEVNRTLEEMRKRAGQLPGERELRRVHQMEGEIALAAGDASRAIQALTEAHKRLPPRVLSGPAAGVIPPAAQIWFRLGQAHLAARQPDEAARWFTRVVDSFSARVNAPIEYARSLYWLGMIHEGRGEQEQGRAAYRRFLELWGDGEIDRDKIAQARRRLTS